MRLRTAVTDRKQRRFRVEPYAATPKALADIEAIITRHSVPDLRDTILPLGIAMEEEQREHA